MRTASAAFARCCMQMRKSTSWLWPILVLSFLVSFSGNVYSQTISTDKLDYVVDETVYMSGSGWMAYENITLTLYEEPETHAQYTFSATADAFGDFAISDFVVELHDIGVKFTLVAVGETPDRTATTIFFDTPKINLDQVRNGPASALDTQTVLLQT